MAAFFATSPAFLYLGDTMEYMTIIMHMPLTELAFAAIIVVRIALTF
jgi:hypothetical protein